MSVLGNFHRQESFTLASNNSQSLRHNSLIRDDCAEIDANGSRLFIWVYRCLLVIVLSVFSLQGAYAAPAAEAGDNNAGAVEEAVETSAPTDPFGRDTPRHTVQGFISALGNNDTLLASNYLNLSKSDNPVTAVRQFKRALDAGGRFQTDLQLSNQPEGSLTDQLPPNQERVGSINVGERSVNLILERVTSNKGEQYWQFSSDTLAALPNVLENAEPTLVNRYTVSFLAGKRLLGYELNDIAAVIILTISSFILTYLVVWLFYHLVNRLYPRLRNKPLPLTESVILPLSVVIMASLLTDIMVYAGVSVTVREPFNRLTEIASWLALTWLLLRVIDAVFKRAERLSYKKNYTERVSILGLLRKLAKALLLIFATIVIFGNLGFDLTTGIAALGVGGLALALGAQKTIENLVGSVVVVADTPVRVGDYCKFGEYEGTVIDIGIRSTRVRTLNRTVVTIPNGDFSSMQIENFAARDMFRFLHHLYLKRTADIETVFKLTQHLNDYIDEHDLTNQEWNQARIAELRQDCYVIELQAYVNASGAAEFYDKQNVIFTDVLQEVAKFDVEHALPTQQLIVHRDGQTDHHPQGPVALQKQAKGALDSTDKERAAADNLNELSDTKSIYKTEKDS